MLKNWIVKTKQIKNAEKGFTNHVEYLADKSRASHHYTNISILTDNAKEILRAIERHKDKRRKHGLRGGGISNYCTSFIMTIPTDIEQPTPEDWKKILNITYRAIANEIGTDAASIKQHAYAVLHDESSSQDKPSHVHLLVSNVIDDVYQKKITQYAVTHIVKRALNDGIRITVGEDNYNYSPRRRQKYNKPYWVVRIEKAKLIEKKVNQLKAKYQTVFRSIQHWANNYLASLPVPSEQRAIEVAMELDTLNDLSEKCDTELMPIIEKVEQLNNVMPDNSKVSPKRKRRRRKKN
ncbi:hypothetical protein E5672_18785 [Alteromonas portus]|uniref:Relaxase n=1 Tax=Alteromonas portus TaxID=2565549 RepID=A0A4U0Z7Z7_9ALTE|nr:hypothetical protein [Alteromonas portus]TKB00717.1 hypothetical protein E5672_18785 [Alteromonas portus]